MDISELFSVMNTIGWNPKTGNVYERPQQPTPIEVEKISIQKAHKQKGPNLSQRAEQINKAIEEWERTSSKQAIEGAKRGAKATVKSVKGGVNYMKPIARLGGRVLGVGADIANAGQLIASDDPFDKWAGGIGLAGSALQKASIPLAASGVGVGPAAAAAGIGTALQQGGAVAPIIRDWVQGYQQQKDFEDNLSEQELMDLAKQRGLL